MSNEEKVMENGHSNAHIENTQADSVRRGSLASFGRRGSTSSKHDDGAQHRIDDDRADEARGRDADQFPPGYWYSWRFLGSMFAVGMAFMGGIGGK